MTIENDVFRAIVETSIDAVVIIDRSGQIIFWNHSAESMFGYSYQEVLTKNLHDILPPRHQRKKANDAFKQFQQRGSSSLTNTLIQAKALTKNDDLIDVQFYFNTVALGSEMFTYAFLRDVSNLVALQEKCEKIGNELLNEKEKILDASMPEWTHPPKDSNAAPTPILNINEDSSTPKTNHHRSSKSDTSSKSETPSQSNIQSQPDTQRQSGTPLNSTNAIEGIDLQEGLKTFNGDWPLYNSLLQKFADSQEDFYQRFKDTTNNKHQSIYCAHSLAGTAANLQILSVFKQAKQLEHACINNAPEGTIDRHLSQVTDTLNKLIPALRALVDATDSNKDMSNSSVTLSKEHVLNSLRKILSRCLQNDSEALILIEQLLNESSGYEDKVETIKSLLEQFNFEDAEILINQLILTIEQWLSSNPLS